MIDTLLACVESRMIAAVSPLHARNNAVCLAALHHLSAGGTRLRARLCLEASTLLGVDASDAIALAGICELLHNASLIHDDLIDRAAMRRGLLSVWSAFDDATAICAGDLLLASAFVLVGELRQVDMLAQVLALVHRCTRDVILGQSAELSSLPKTLEGYELTAISKSASLLSLPTELALLLSGNVNFMARAQRAANAFAVAYQMLDDLADYREDVRHGALNAVSVVEAAGNLAYRSACTLIGERAEELIQGSIVDASNLPMGCGAAMVKYAQKMLLTLNDLQHSAVGAAEPLRHAG